MKTQKINWNFQRKIAKYTIKGVLNIRIEYKDKFSKENFKRY